MVIDFNQDGSGSAVFDNDRIYRYCLTRIWHPGAMVLTWVMLNPSTADAFKLDPTLKNCEFFSRKYGWGGMLIVNLFAFRATNPKDLLTAVDPVGSRNDEFLQDLTGDIVVGWGNHKLVSTRSKIIETLKTKSCWCLGTNKNGSPKHPLYIRHDTVFQKWS